MFMNFINEHLTNNGKLLVSGLVEWSFNSVLNKVQENGYKLLDKFQQNEWCTATFTRL